MEGAEQAVVTGEVGFDMGFWGRLGNIFGNPAKAFEAINNRPTWLVPFLIIIAVTIISAAFILPLIVQNTIDEVSKNPEVTQEQIEMISKFIPVSAIGGSLLMMAVWLFGLSGILYFVGSVILGGDSRFKKVLAVNSWSMLIVSLSSVVTVPLMLIKQNMYTSLSLAMVLPPEALGSRAFVLLSQINFFSIWYLAVLAVGFGVVYGMSTRKAMTSIAILWVIWVAFMVAIGGLGGPRAA
jgi:hypothetical protein